MTLSGKVVIEAPPERIWRALLDPGELEACLPYCESLERMDEDIFRSVVKMKVAVIEARFTLITTIVERRRLELLRTVTEGEDRNLASLVRQENTVELRPAPGGGTELAYRTEFTVTGRLGKLGLTVLGAKARKVAEEFVQSLKAHIETSQPTVSPGQEAET